MRKQLSRRMFLRGAAVGAGALVLASCQPKVVEVTKVVKETVVTEKEVEKVVTATPASKGPVTIQWLNFWGGEREPLMIEVIKRFEEEYPYITVENVLGPDDRREEQAATAVASKTPPSLIMVPRVGAQKFAHEGLIVPIDDYIEARGIDLYDVFYKGEIDNCKWAGHYWSYPNPTGGGATCIWFYTKKPLRDAGFDPEAPPKTWQEVEEVVKATTVIKDGELLKAGMSSVNSFNFPAWLYCNNGQYYGDDSKQLLFNQPEAVETLEWMLKLREEYMGGNEAYNAFFEGIDLRSPSSPFFDDRLCLYPSAVWNFGSIKVTDPERYEDLGAWGVMTVPYNGNNPEAKATGISGFQYAWNQVIPKGSSQAVQDAAYEFLEWFGMRRAGGCWFMLAQGRPSPVKKCNDSPEYYEVNPYWDQVLEAMEVDVSVPVTPVQGEINDLVNESLEEVWFGLKKPKEALDWAYDQAQPILDKFWSGG